MDRWTRYDQIPVDVRHRRPLAWLALDDDPLGWPAAEREHLVLVPPELGLASANAQGEFTRRMAEVF
jgi:hypothetical protein